MAELANSVDLDEMAQNEPPHLDLHCLLSSLWILNMILLGLTIFWKFADENFVNCFLVVKELNTPPDKVDFFSIILRNFSQQDALMRSHKLLFYAEIWKFVHKLSLLHLHLEPYPW